MIKGRRSEDHLHTDVLLSKISEYDIFKYYCPNFIELSKKFCSDLREDQKPGVSIVYWKGKLLYKDLVILIIHLTALTMLSLSILAIL